MATLAFLSFFDEAQGESVQKGKEKWIELRGWSWGVDADTSWTRAAARASASRIPDASPGITTTTPRHH